MKVSVAIACYNRAGLIRNAIESALAQDTPPCEVLIVDDGSTDDSARVAESYGPPVRVVRCGVNRGGAAAENRAVAEAAGDWVAFLDSDDLWKPHKLTRQIELAHQFPEAPLLFCDVEHVNAGKVEERTRFDLGGVRGQQTRQGAEARQLFFERSFLMALLTSSRVITSAIMVRRDLKGLHFPEHLRVAYDWSMFLDLILHVPFAAVDEVLVTRNITGDALTNSVARTLREDVLVLERLLALGELTPEETQKVKLALEDKYHGALYHSLRNGDAAASRSLFRHVSPQRLGLLRYGLYGIAGYCPGWLLRYFASVRA